MLTGINKIKMSKRKFQEKLEVDENMKRPRRRTRSRSEPLPEESDEPEKREALKRLFGRYCAIRDSRRREQFEDSDDSDYDLDENDDPLLDDVPVNMDPEQLGFLVCAQETLRFLYGRGITVNNPTFIRLRHRLLRGIADIAAA